MSKPHCFSLLGCSQTLQQPPSSGVRHFGGGSLSLAGYSGTEIAISKHLATRSKSLTLLDEAGLNLGRDLYSVSQWAKLKQHLKDMGSPQRLFPTSRSVSEGQVIHSLLSQQRQPQARLEDVPALTPHLLLAIGARKAAQDVRLQATWASCSQLPCSSLKAER